MIPRGKIKDKRSAILSATLIVIAKNGFHASSVKQIADEAKVATGTIYVYFENKDEVIKSLFVSIRKEINEIINSGYNSNLTFKDNYYNLWKAVFDFYYMNKLKFMFLEQYHSSPFFNDMDNDEGSNVLSPAVKLFEEAKKKGELTDLPSITMMSLTNGSIISLLRLHFLKEFDLHDIDLDKYIIASYRSIEKF
jgi:AcrR family transcriptional regulator